MAGVTFQIRLGLVLYGGISLAIYMNGMAQEVLALVRASHARRMAALQPDAPFVREQQATNPYYRLLEAAGVDVTIDVIAGTSAGGLNGLMLAKALATGAPDLGPMAELWKRHAQVSKLSTYDREPVSLFSGTYLKTELEKVLQHLSRSGDPALAAQAEVLDLFVTATDVRGHRWSRPEAFAQDMQGISHKYFFHLRKRTRDPVTGRSYNRNDFASPDQERQQRIDHILAKVGQATAALPPAFPPVRIGRSEAEEAGLDLLGDVEAPAEGIWFSDGGVLMNRPFEPVVETVSKRNASIPALPSKQVVAFLEVVAQQVGAPEQTEPTLLENAVAGLTLTMQQDIADDLERLAAENEKRRALQDLVEEMDEAAGQMDGPWSLMEQAAREALAQVAPAREPGAAAAGSMPGTAGSPVLQSYYGLRQRRVREAFRQALTGALEGIGLTGALRDAALAAVLAEVPWLEAPPYDPALKAFLDRYDAEYHQRRLHFLLTRIQKQFRPGVVPSDREAMTRLRKGLWDALEDWRNAVWILGHAGRLEPQPEPWTGAAERLNQAFMGIRQVLGPGPWSVRESAIIGLKRAAGEAVAAIDAYLSLVSQRTAAEVERALTAAHSACPLRDSRTGEPVRQLGSPELTADRLARSYAQFESRDLILFPLQTYGAGREWEPVELLRLGASGAQGWVRKRPEEKITGLMLHHFGAFLNERWRANDIMWGRLDAAELLTRMVVTEAGLLKPGVKPLPGQRALPESTYHDDAVRALADRRRQIVAAFPELVDLEALRQSVQQSGAALQEGEPLPDWALQRHLEERYRIIPEGVEGLPPRQLAGELLIVMHNLIYALEKSGFHAGGVQKLLLGLLRPLNWVARLILVPRQGLFGIVQGNAASLMTVLGAALLLLQMTGAVRLTTAGWWVVVALLSPAVLDSLFRPTPLRLVVSGALALVSGAAALAQAELPAVLSWLEPVQQMLAGLPGWVHRFAGVWGFFAFLFAALLAAYVANRRMRSPLE
ncbi:MAG: patatin-like protein [Bacillota bacterium]